jgi:hypothetical protein
LNDLSQAFDEIDIERKEIDYFRVFVFINEWITVFQDTSSKSIKRMSVSCKTISFSPRLPLTTKVW